MIELLTWISLISGGVLILLLLLSLSGGLELDFDLGSETDVDSGDLGIIKGLLTFLSIGCWVVKLVLAVDQNPIFALAIGIVAGLVAVYLLNLMLRLLLRNQSEVNWKSEDAIYKEAKVYLKIPARKGYGIIHVNINGAVRELKAKTINKKEIATGEKVLVEDIVDNYAKVSIITS